MSFRPRPPTVSLAAFAVLNAAAAAADTFNYTGSQQTYTVPAGVTAVIVDVMGAAGGSPCGGLGGGGRVQAKLSVTPGETLYIYVGGVGGDRIYQGGATGGDYISDGGFNGGGNGGTGGSYTGGAAGGGASDIRQGGTALSNRVVVAGGGGGAGGYACFAGGHGGGGGNPSGQNGTNSYNYPGVGGGGGGSQSAGGATGTGQTSGQTGSDGSLGIGGSAAVNYGGGGGGGGYYGGGSGAGEGVYAAGGGGGGGSSYTSGSNATYTTGYRSGNGLVSITESPPPAIQSASGASTSGLTVNWSTNGNDSAVAYSAQASTEPGFSTIASSVTTAANATFQVLTGLSANTTYYTRAIALIGGATSFATESGYPRAASSVVGLWHFNEGSGTSAGDSSGNGRTGTMVNSPAWTAGRFGTGLSFNGSSQYVDLGTGALLDGADGMTIEAWVRTLPGYLNDYRAIYYAGSTNMTLQRIATSGGWRFFAGGTSIDYTTATLDNTWTYISATYDKVTMKIYVNGQLVVSGANTGAISDSGVAKNIGRFTGGSQYFAGTIDEVRIASRALSASEIAQSFGSSPLATLVQTPTGIVFDEISTAAITASAYAQSPAFSNLNQGQAGTAVAIDTGTGFNYAAFHTGGNTWASRAEMGTARQSLGVASVGGKVYAIGGRIGGNVDLNVNEEFDPAANAWTTRAPLPTARSSMGAASLGGKIYLIGGYISAITQSLNEVYDPAGNTWVTMAPLTPARGALAAAAAAGKIYALGGSQSPSDQNAAFDPAMNSWADKAPMPTPRTLMAAAAVGNKIYVIGGNTVPYTQNEEYDAALNVWVTKAAAPRPRHSGSGAASIGGKVFVVGGGDAPANANEEYDPANNQWTTRAAMISTRYALGAAAAGGRLFAVGGYSSDYSKRHEEFDPGAAQKFPGLAPNTQYAFKAKARNAAGVETAETTAVSTYTLAAATVPQSGAPIFTAVSSTVLTVNWSSGTASGGYNGPGATYRVQVSSRADFIPSAGSSVTANSFATLTGLSSSTAYYARVQGINAIGQAGDFLILGTTTTSAGGCTGPMAFALTDPTLTAGASLIRAVHLTELRTAVDTLRSDAGLSAYSWTDSLSPGATLVKEAHVSELRAALSAVYTACGQAAPTFTDPTLTSGATLVRSVHISDLRTKVQNAP